MAATSVKKHPIRGAIYGLLMGVGASLILAGQGVIAFGETGPFIIVIVIGLVVGIVWGLFGPAKDPKDPEPLDVVDTDGTDNAAFAAGAAAVESQNDVEDAAPDDVASVDIGGDDD
jgi:hypothetical protein